MRRIFETPETALLLALSLVLLASVGFVATGAPADSIHSGGSAWLLGAFALAGVVLAMFRPRHSISLGAAVLAPVALFFGPLVSGLLAGCLRTIQILVRRLAESRERPAVTAGVTDEGASSAVRGPRASITEVLTSVTSVAIAALTAASLWTRMVLAPDSPSWVGSSLAWAGVAGLAQVVLLAGLGWIAAWASGRDAREVPMPEPRLLLDLAGWMLGGALVAAFAVAGVAVGLVVLAAVTLLAAELIRHRGKLARGRSRAMTLRQMTTVGQRIGGPRMDGPFIGGTLLELEPIVAQILSECRDLVRAQWLHLEITDSDIERASWRMDPDGKVEEGVPQPPEAPPALPGLHRRAVWQVLDRQLASGERTIAKIRLWTDPRQTEYDKVRLLDSFLPQLAAPLAAILAEQKAGRDALTGVSTRVVLEEQLERVFERCCIDGASMAVLMCDVDHFKAINDQFGHSVGDRALQRIAAALAQGSRGRDVVCRYGGEEFTILMDGANATAAVAVAERLRKAVEQIRIDADGTAILLTASFGIASFPDTYVGSGAELVPLADAALYEAKRRGRNRTLLARGQGRFENARGRQLKGDTKSEAIEAPRLFV